MSFKIAMLVGVFALAGCSKATDTIIPSNMATWDKELAPVVQKLDEKDKTDFVAYVTRMKLSEVLGNKQGIPFGTTVGKALEDQRKWADERAKAEVAEKAEQTRRDTEAAALKVRLDAERVAAAKKIGDAVTAALLSKSLQASDYRAGVYRDTQNFVVGVQNKSDKDIIGVEGEIEFVDVFSKVVGSVIPNCERETPPFRARSESSLSAAVGSTQLNSAAML